MHDHHSALGLVKARRPILPVTLVRPHAAFRAARFFVEKFPGKSLYAVKANPDPDLLKVLWEAGITHYDVASMGEVRLVSETLPEATLCFMHPVKAPEAIEEDAETLQNIFSDSLQQDDVTVPFKTSDGGYYVFHFGELVEPKPLTLEEA